MYDPLLKSSFCLCAVKVKIALDTCLWSLQDCIWHFLPQKYTDLHELQQYYLSRNILLQVQQLLPLGFTLSITGRPASMVVCYNHTPYDVMTHIYNNGYNNSCYC